MLSKALFTWLAFPVYVWQGISLRLRIERLVPADIAHEGRFAGSGDEVRLLVVGDSSVAGVGMSRLEDTLTFNIAQTLNRRTNRQVYWRAAGANSATASDLRDHVIPNLDRRDYTHIVVVVGTNDMKNFHAVGTFKKHFGTLVYAVRTRFPEAHILWSPVADMTLIPALPRSLGRILQMRAELINAMGARLCRERGIDMAGPVPIDGPEGFARDGFHAGPEGYRSWADHLAGYIIADVTETPPPDAGSSDLQRRQKDDHEKARQGKFPEIAALAQAGQSQRLDDLN